MGNKDKIWSYVCSYARKNMERAPGGGGCVWGTDLDLDFYPYSS